VGGRGGGLVGEGEAVAEVLMAVGAFRGGVGGGEGGGWTVGWGGEGEGRRSG